MPSVLFPNRALSSTYIPSDGSRPPRGHDDDHGSQVHIDKQIEQSAAQLHRSVTESSTKPTGTDGLGSAFSQFEQFVRTEGQPPPLSVCFKNLTTYGHSEGVGVRKTRTLKDAIWRTLTCQDIYESIFKRLLFPTKIEHGTPLIHDFSGVVRNGQILLVLGNPGSGCSTFLRTIGNDHDAFLGIKGQLDYSGMSSQELSKRYRGSVAYIPEDAPHLPTLTVRQTLGFALKNKTPKRLRHEIPRFMDEYARIFGMTHTFDTLVGDEYIRGISGGERKRVSILESLASGSSVNAWDGSTRGLDASSALDYMRSLRIMTDACEQATIVSLYQASDAMYDLVDKVMLIEDGRMLYQGPASDAEDYFSSLGYKRKERQTMSDFLSSVASSTLDNIRDGYEKSCPRGAAELEKVFRNSQAFKDVQNEIQLYETEQTEVHNGIRSRTEPSTSEFNARMQDRKSRFVTSSSSYVISFWRQTLLCLQREWWQLRGHKAPLITRFVCVAVSALLLGSMFYDMPTNTQGVYSRGGLCFYSAILVAWFQLAELESSFADRKIVQRHKRFAMVRPSAVVAAKTIMDIPVTTSMVSMYSVITYFMSGLRTEPGSFFAFDLAIILSAIAFTAFYRLFAAASPRMEIGLRYCGLLTVVAMIFGGYVRSVDVLLSDVPWVGWLAYLTPSLFTFEILMAMEFHGRTFDCAPDSLIPSGPNYGDATYQSCAYDGIGTGATHLNGEQYIQSQFGFSYDNVARNFGILLAFIFGCVSLTMILVENLSWASGGGATEFVHSSVLMRNIVADDEENAAHLAKKTPVELPHNNDSDATLEGNSEKYWPVFIWRDVSYAVQHDSKDKVLLKGVSGYGEPGTLTALVGRSGAGKSTLMNVLTQQAPGKVTGEIKAGAGTVTSSIGRDLGFCQQMDIHVNTATVREAFEFSALLRQSRGVPRNEKLAYVDHVLDILNMNELQGAVIGSLSLEQRKRTTIGVELCARPGLALFLDEPTSGLDGQGALNIVKLLRSLAAGGQTIICTIHQANQEQFELFDRVLALGRGGRPYYFGDIGPQGQFVLEYFSKRGTHAPSSKNVAEFMIEVEAKSEENGRDWSKEWAESADANAILHKIESFTSKAERQMVPKANATEETAYASGTGEQIFQLTKRTLVQYWRTPDYIYSRLYCSFFHSLLNGLAFLQLSNEAASIQFRIFCCFIVLMIVPEFINASSLIFVENRNVWIGREYPSRIYGWLAFTTAQIISEIPWALVGGIIFYVLFYFLVGLPLGVPAVYTFLMMLMFHLFSTSWGQWIAAFSADAMMAANVMPFLIIVGEFFNGVLQPHDLMPAVWRYTLYYLSPFTYWIGGIVAMVVGNLNIQCLESELIRFQPPPNSTCGTYAQEWLTVAKGYLANPDATSYCGYCQYSSGQDYLDTRDIVQSQAWRNFGLFALFCTTNWLCVYLWVYIKSVKNWLPW